MTEEAELELERVLKEKTKVLQTLESAEKARAQVEMKLEEVQARSVGGLASG